MATLLNISSVFSRNMEDIVVAFDGESSLSIGVSCANSENIDFTLCAIDKQVSIHASDIVSNYARAYEPHIESIDSHSESMDEIQIELKANNVTLERRSIKALFGGYSALHIQNETDFLQHNFLTWRPQVDNVVRGIKQQLSFVICPPNIEGSNYAPAPTTRKIYAKVYFRSLLPKEVEVGSFNEDNTIYRIDCSYNTIRGLVDDVDDEITAYDIFGAEEKRLSSVIPIKTQRFVVKHQSDFSAHFFFQNSLGGFDTIMATGCLKEIGQGDLFTSFARGVEAEVSNDYVRTWEVNTGYISTLQEESLWREFLQSTNRYVLFTDGSYRRIVVEEYKAERTKLELGSFTFTYHYAEKEKGYYFEKQDLDEYIK